MLGERDDVGVEAAEEEAAVALEAGDLAQIVGALGVELFGVAGAAGILDLEQFAVVGKRPAVEWAGQGLPVIGLAPTQHRAAVRARVDEAVELALLVAGDDDGLAADGGREVVADLRDLRFVGEVHPVALEDVFHLELEQILVGEDRPVGADDAFFRDVLDGIGQGALEGLESGRHGVASFLRAGSPTGWFNRAGCRRGVTTITHSDSRHTR